MSVATKPTTNTSSPDQTPQSMAHHNTLPRRGLNLFFKKGVKIEKRYGVPQTQRLLTMGNYHKHHDEICHLMNRLGLDPRERDAVFVLLRLFIYYGKVYSKAADVAEDAYISKRTFWRAVGKLRDLGVLEVFNRYANHRQISNLYRLDKLVLLLARYLAEHGRPISRVGVQLAALFKSFWSEIWDADINLSLTAPVRLKMT